MLPINAFLSETAAYIAQTGVGLSPCDLGGAVLIQTFQDVKVDPYDGTSREFHFRGYAVECNAGQAAALANGWQARIETNASPWPTLVVTIPDPGSSEFTDRWEFNDEFKQQDLWINLGVINYLQGTGGLSLSQIMDAKQRLTNYVNNPDQYSWDTVTGGDTPLETNAAVINIFQLMLMGGQYVEVAQPVISRKRSYDIAYTGPTMVTRNTQTVYSTSALVSNYSIPPAVANQIAADPDTEPVSNFSYGWKARKNNLTIIPAKNKNTEEVDWVWDQWSTILYQYIS